MFTLKGNEFSSLISRQFVQNFSVQEASGSLKGKFDCQSKNIRDENFDILFLSSDFHDDVKIEKLQDTTHVSLHFQMRGNSAADISGLKPGMNMGSGQFNLINCVDPVSTFLFPKQKKYEYICVGLKPAFFNEVLIECGSDYKNLLIESQNLASFALFQTNRIINNFQLNALKLIQNPNVADSLKIPFLRSKVKELVLLTLNNYNNGETISLKPLSKSDESKLFELREYLSKNYLLTHTLEGLSKNFLLNEFKLKSGFKQLFGTSVFKYIQLLRLEYAYDLIQDGSLPINEIAFQVGYESDAAFIRAFKNQYYNSPGKLKQSR
ncbi:transcriptional regulator, AraC family [Dyadobacter koreensis]|uniref:Transcriptional regulator, AraC family n=1 Tax=Dyadobacter koreensis TaxID=408657 RepID=A0A1H6Y147_9BACT|nr:AraC family transcriptional regulator [Dyadobacter koreensis]SEJ30842.1 transcriptional regulator, AraC family [Dyadobacter koreensis]